jgi:hypothetical protein
MMLREWQNFYLLAGGAAATLIGLMFVALSLASRTLIAHTRSGFRTWVDPTLTHFAYVLVTALVMVVPVVTASVLGITFILAGAIGVGRSVELLYRAWQQHHRDRRIELDDWLWRFVLPFAGHLLLLQAGVAFLRDVALAFVSLAIATALLLLVGIRNAWDLALWIASQGGDGPT